MKKLISCLFFLIPVISFSQAPANDNFASATLVPTTSTCVTNVNSFTTHTISSATNQTTTITGNSCSSPATNRDVWYRFVTQTEFPVIAVIPTGSSWTTAQRINIQILSGTALTALTEVGCGRSSGTAPTAPATINNTSVIVSPSTELTPGNTYYVRISTTGTPTGTNFGYSICIKEGTASRMGEVFRQTILSAAGVLNFPWEVAYGRDGNLWVTEAQGYKLNKIDPSTGTKTTVLDLSSGSTWLTTNGAPAGSDTLAAINTSSWNGPWPLGTATNPNWPQGGFAGMALHPNFLDGTGTNDYAYVTYVHRYLSGGGTTGGVIFRNKLIRLTYNTSTSKFSMPVVLCDTLPGSNDHNSQRLYIAPVGGINYLFMAEGDMGAGQFGNRDRPNKAQDANSYEGKILRFNLVSDGDAGGNAWIPNDNPFGGSSAVWVTGIRNNQGFVYDPTTSLLYGASHGPYSDDEINIIESGKNYGHPKVIGYASDQNYNGTTTQPLNTSVTAGAPFTDNNGVSSIVPIGDEVANATALGVNYRDPVFSAYASSNATIKTNWKNTPNVPNAGWESEAWSGLDLYSNMVIPGWKRSLVASGLKWGRLIKLNLGTAGTTTLPSNLSQGNTGDTVTYFSSANRYRDIAIAPNGKDIFIVMDNNSSTSGPGVTNPTVPACQGCLIKYSFLGYVVDGASAIGVSTLPKTISVSTNTPNTIVNCNTITIDATNNNLWVPITGPDGNIVAEINANGNNLGAVTSAYYIKSGALRTAGGNKYLNRNITITPTNQPTLPVGSPLVKIRLYFSKAEFDALDADPGSGITAIGDLRILKNNDPISATINSNTQLVTPTNTTLTDLQHGANGYVLQGNISSFSSFYFASAAITLPLDLITFTGALQQDNSALLEWKTDNEINTSHFSIERSTDAVNFNAIGSKQAAGNQAGIHSYSYIDNKVSELQASIIYYRLKMVDLNGKYTYSKVIAISLADIVGKVTVVPNPVINEANISFTAINDGIINCEIYNSNSQKLLQKTQFVRKGNISNISLDMNMLPAGVYVLRLTGAGINTTHKIQKH
jgi:trimeric autotransporter adhesin